MIPLTNTTRLRALATTGLVGASFAALLVYLVLVGGNQEADQLVTFLKTDFRFHVYCPVDDAYNYQLYQQNFGGNLALDAPKNSSLYVVYIQARNSTSLTFNQTTNTFSNNTQMGLYYCGLAREWNGTCRDAQIVCSAPGPMFYLPVDEEVTIVWVNNITSQGLDWVEDGCYDPATPEADCMIDAKILPTTSPQQEGCTFNKPTNYSFSSRKVRVNKTQVPLSPHIHGLQTRPAFDGNPLSWFNNVGDKGVGYFSLNDSKYFYQFDKPDSFYQFSTTNQRKNMKIIKALNKQLPGNLFYHDHAMKSTKYNVASGLSGLYILYNKTAEAKLPTGKEEKFILFSHANDGDLRNMTTFVPPPHPMPITHKDCIYTLNDQDVYQRNMTYRMRVLNAHFDNVYYNVSFAVYYQTQKLPNGNTQYIELDPFSQKFPLTSNLHTINFSVIGTDSALFNNPVHNVNTFDLGAAERVQLLIRLGAADGIPASVSKFYLICYDGNTGDYVIKYRFLLASSTLPSSNKYSPPALTSPLPLPFKDISTIPKNKVAVNRMRGLFSRPKEQSFVINGHFMFGMGDTDNPKIGTTQDWYIVNNLWEPHPMHFHLVNFQVVQTYSLKKIPEGCTFYELDFFRFSNYSAFQGLTNAQLCTALDILSLDQTNQLYHYLGNYSLESKIVQSNIGPVSGLNVMQPISTAAEGAIYAQSGCPLGSSYKYICGDTFSSTPSWYRRWKETALVRQYSVSVLRIRWTSTTYDENVQTYPYFHIPEDQLMEFPGFVYHCHILPHEDNEMMRPYMLLPSDKYRSSNMAINLPVGVRNLNISNLMSSSGSPTSLSSLVPANFDYWFAKAQQINTFIGCPK